MALMAPQVDGLTRAGIDVPTGGVSMPSLAIAAVTGALVWVGTATVVGRGRLDATLADGWVELAGPALLALVLAAVACEQIWPAQPRRLLAAGHVQDACFFVLYASCVVPVMTLLGVAFAALLGSHAGWIVAPWTASWPLWLILAPTVVAMDAANWLAHWADHRIGALWRFHAVHHSQEELSVLTSFRAHPLVHTTGFFLATIAVLGLMGDRPVAPALVTLYVCVGTFAHTNVRWSFGPLGKVIVSPAYHRIHHAVDARNGANLGIVLTLWDVLAARAVFPTERTRAAATGLAGRPLAVEQADPRPRIRILAGQLVEPFTSPPREDSGGHRGGASRGPAGLRDASLTGLGAGRHDRERRLGACGRDGGSPLGRGDLGLPTPVRTGPAVPDHA